MCSFIGVLWRRHVGPLSDEELFHFLFVCFVVLSLDLLPAMTPFPSLPFFSGPGVLCVGWGVRVCPRLCRGCAVCTRWGCRVGGRVRLRLLLCLWCVCGVVRGGFGRRRRCCCCHGCCVCWCGVGCLVHGGGLGLGGLGVRRLSCGAEAVLRVWCDVLGCPRGCCGCWWRLCVEAPVVLVGVGLPRVLGVRGVASWMVLVAECPLVGVRWPVVPAAMLPVRGLLPRIALPLPGGGGPAPVGV